VVILNSTGKELSNNAPHHRENRAAGIATHLLDFRKKYVLGAALLLIVAMCAGSAGLIYGKRWAWPPIRSDGFGYYAYLPATLIHGDPSFKTLMKLRQSQLPWYPSLKRRWSGIRRYPTTGGYVNQYTMGVALLNAPFFLIAHAAASLMGNVDNGFSMPYQIGSIAAACFYLVAGLSILYLVLKQFFPVNVCVLTLAVHLFGTPLFHYGTFDGCFSHVYSFFLVALFLFAILHYEEKPILRSLLCGALLGLIWMTRQSNIIFGLFFALYGVSNCADLRRIVLNAGWLGSMVWFALGFLLTISPQLVYWKYLAGSWFIISYGDLYFHWFSPQILNVLFSVKKGLFFWSPVLMASTAGLYYLRRHVPELFGATVIFMPLNLYVISSWHSWWYGGSFGQRAFVESVPIFALGFASLWTSLGKSFARRVLIPFIVASTAMSLIYMIAYWMHVIPYDGPTWQQYSKVFLFR
jgi:hypothetical protein